MKLQLGTMTITGTERRQAVSQITRGLQRIEKNGWCQGHYQDSNQRVCAMGAFDAPTDATVALLQAGIKKVTPTVRMRERDAFNDAAVIGWNDRKGRKVSEVKRAFKHAIKIGQGLRPVKG